MDEPAPVARDGRDVVVEGIAVAGAARQSDGGPTTRRGQSPKGLVDPGRHGGRGCRDSRTLRGGRDVHAVSGFRRASHQTYDVMVSHLAGSPLLAFSTLA